GYRIITAVTGHVDVRALDKSRTIAFVAKPPGRAREGVLEVRPAGQGLPVGEIGHRIKAVDGKPAVPVGDDALGRRGLDRETAQQGQREKTHRRREDASDCGLPSMPPCRHSSCRMSTDSKWRMFAAVAFLRPAGMQGVKQSST